MRACACGGDAAAWALDTNRVTLQAVKPSTLVHTVRAEPLVPLVPVLSVGWKRITESVRAATSLQEYKDHKPVVVARCTTRLSVSHVSAITLCVHSEIRTGNH